MRVAVDRDAAPVVDDLEAPVGRGSSRRCAWPGSPSPRRCCCRRSPTRAGEGRARRSSRCTCRAASRTAWQALEDLDVGGGVAGGLGARLGRSWTVMRCGTTSWSAGMPWFGIVGQCGARAAGDDRVEAVELLVGVEVDHEPAASTGAHDADLASRASLAAAPRGPARSGLRGRRSRRWPGLLALSAHELLGLADGELRVRERPARTARWSSGSVIAASARPWPSLMRPSVMACRVSGARSRRRSELLTATRLLPDLAGDGLVGQSRIGRSARDRRAPSRSG